LVKVLTESKGPCFLFNFFLDHHINHSSFPQLYNVQSLFYSEQLDCNV
jgi:hypothetical protein